MTAEERTLGELTQQIAQAHQSLQGVRPDVAELQYLIEAQQLDNYGLEYYPAKVTSLQLDQYIVIVLVQFILSVNQFMKHLCS